MAEAVVDADLRTGPKEPKSTTLAIEEEDVVSTFQRHMLLPPDECLYALQATILHLTRSSLHRCLQRHGISRLPEFDGYKPARKKFMACLIGYLHVDLAEVRTEQDKRYLLVAIDGTSKFAFVELHQKVTCRIATDFLRHVAAAVPHSIHTVVTHNGTHFTDPTGDGWTPEEIKEMRSRKLPFLCHALERIPFSPDHSRRS